MRVAVETGVKRIFAVAIDWPGLARGAKSEALALETLVAYAARYRHSVGSAAAALDVTQSASHVEVVDRRSGGSGTDYGVPSMIADFDRVGLDPTEMQRRLDLLRGAWSGFDSAVSQAAGHELTKGPRGGGRSLEAIIEHVREAERSAYIGQLGAKAPPPGSDMAAVHAAFLDAVAAKVRGELPERGPRGGERWPAAYAIRRAAWHALDHAWEIEDRS